MIADFALIIQHVSPGLRVSAENLVQDFFDGAGFDLACTEGQMAAQILCEFDKDHVDEGGLLLPLSGRIWDTVLNPIVARAIILSHCHEQGSCSW